MQLEYVDIEWSSSFGGYSIKFKDANNKTYSFIMNNKYFPISLGQGLFAFEEEYKIIDCIELSQSYVKAREKLIKIYEKLFNETVEEAFCPGEKYITLEGIIDGIEWELKTEKEKEKTLEKYL